MPRERKPELSLSGRSWGAWREAGVELDRGGRLCRARAQLGHGKGGQVTQREHGSGIRNLMSSNEFDSRYPFQVTR